MRFCTTIEKSLEAAPATCSNPFGEWAFGMAGLMPAESDSHLQATWGGTRMPPTSILVAY
jgi:hypothetical protein